MSPIRRFIPSSPIPSGLRTHAVRLQDPGDPVPDGDGGYTPGWIDLVPPVLSARIEPATARTLERTMAGTVIENASLLVTLPFHPQISMQTRLLFTDRHGVDHQLSVLSVTNPDFSDRELVLACTEQEPKS